MQLMWKIPTFDWYFKKSQLEKNKSLEFKWHWLSCRLACKSTFVCTVEVLGFCLKQGIGVNTIFVWNVTTERELLYEIKDKEKTMGLNPLWKSSVQALYVRASLFLLCPVVSRSTFSILVWPYKKQDSTKNCPTNHPTYRPRNCPRNCHSMQGIFVIYFEHEVLDRHWTPYRHQADTKWQIFSDTWSSTWLCKGYKSALTKLKK